MTESGVRMPGPGIPWRESMFAARARHVQHVASDERKPAWGRGVPGQGTPGLRTTSDYVFGQSEA